MKILVDMDGVLKAKDDAPISTGILMVSTMSAYNQIFFMTSTSVAETEMWLDINKIVDYDGIIDSSVSLTSEDLKQRQVNVARSRGNLELFITNDPTLWAYAFEQGIPSVMFAVPAYTRPEFRPDAPKKLRAWGEIEEAIKAQNALRTKDARLSRGEGINFE